MSIMAGRDERDMTTIADFWQSSDVKPNQRIGLIKQFMDEGVDDAVRQATLNYASALESAGHTIEEVDVPMVKHSLAMYYIIVPAEISSNLARYDGVRYGRRRRERQR